MSERVLFPFVGDSVGGSHVSAALLMEALPKQGFEPTALVHSDGPLEPWLRARGFPVLRADLPYLAGGGGVAGLAKIAAAAPRLALFACRQGFSVVHANDGRMIASWMPAARLAGATSIAHRRTRWSQARLAHLALRCAHHIITISDYVRDSLPGDLQKRASVIANPFELSNAKADDSRAAMRHLTGGNGPIIAFVGTLQPQKRADIFIRAAALMRQKRGDLHFVLFGRDNGIESSLRALASEVGVGPVTTFAGFRQDLGNLIAGCDLLLAPAVNEGHGRVLVEAMLAGVPVIASASGGHREIVDPDRTGVLVPPDSPEALAVAAFNLLSDPARAQALAGAASAFAHANFSPEAHAVAVAALYRRVMASP